MWLPEGATGGDLRKMLEANPVVRQALRLRREQVANCPAVSGVLPGRETLRRAAGTSLRLVRRTEDAQPVQAVPRVLSGREGDDDVASRGVKDATHEPCRAEIAALVSRLNEARAERDHLWVKLCALRSEVEGMWRRLDPQQGKGEVD
jgi:hypothetical protein